MVPRPVLDVDPDSRTPHPLHRAPRDGRRLKHLGQRYRPCIASFPRGMKPRLGTIVVTACSVPGYDSWTRLSIVMRRRRWGRGQPSDREERGSDFVSLGKSRARLAGERIHSGGRCRSTDGYGMMQGREEAGDTGDTGDTGDVGTEAAPAESTSAESIPGGERRWSVPRPIDAQAPTGRAGVASEEGRSRGRTGPATWSPPRVSSPSRIFPGGRATRSRAAASRDRSAGAS
jgi:hypothetical protein